MKQKTICKTPPPPYYAVIFSSVLSQDISGYDQMATEMLEMASKQEGFLGYDSARNEMGITVSYWKDLQSIDNWRKNFQHLLAKKLGKDKWYQEYRTRIALVDLEY